MKYKSFKRELITSFLVIGISSIVILGSFQVYQLYSLVQEKEEHQYALTTFIEDYITNYVESHVQIIETLSFQIANDFSQGDFEAIQDDLKNVASSYPGFVNFYIGDETGESLLFYPEVPTDGVLEENYNFSDRGYYQELIESESSVISPAFHGRGGTDLLLVAIVHPIFDENEKMQGYLLGALDLQQLENYTNERIDQDATTTVIVDQENHAIVHPDIDTGRELLDVSDTEIMHQISEENKPSGSFTIQDENSRHFITFGTIESLGWKIWISTPVIQIIGTFLDSIFATILVTLLTAGIVIATSLVLSNRLEEAIQRLLNHLKKYTNKHKNNEPMELVTEIRGPREVNEILVHFNTMIKEIDKNRLKLLELNQELEQRVKDRTANVRIKHAELEAVLESMFEGIMLLDNTEEIRYVNDFFLQIIAPKENDQQLTMLDDVTERFLTLFDVDKETLQTFFSHPNSPPLQLKRQPSAGEEKSIYLLHRFSVTSDEETIGFGLLIQDVTKDVEIDTLKDNLISLTSHEFKTPITTIKGSVETLLREDVEWEAEFQQELLEGVLEDIERIQQLVNDWMDISKIEAGSMHIEQHHIKVEDVIEESIALIPPVLKEDADFTFDNKASEDLTFYADKRRVQQVLINLFTNGLRYNDSKKKEIQVTLTNNQQYAIISVLDNGIGIAEEHKERIFNRFYQVDATATRRSGGTGLGLAIVKGIMDAHEGKIEVESEINEGSTFTLYFPLKEDKL